MAPRCFASETPDGYAGRIERRSWRLVFSFFYSRREWGVLREARSARGVPPTPGCFLQRVRKRLKRKGLSFWGMQKSAKKRKRVRKNVKRKGIDQNTLAGLEDASGMPRPGRGKRHARLKVGTLEC